MKAITIKEPFASLIIDGYKKYEFRTWKTNYRGKILIHAGKGKDSKNTKRFESYKLNYIYGTIIGEAEITDCIEVTSEFIEDLTKENDEVYKNSGYGSNYAFKIENVVRYEKPIFINGQLGFWNYE